MAKPAKRPTPTTTRPSFTKAAEPFPWSSFRSTGKGGKKRGKKGGGS
jgi:hypothetical protein